MAAVSPSAYNSSFFIKHLRPISDVGSGSDYRQYVFKDGRFVGAFDEMYRNSSEVPWHQDRNAFGIFSDLDVAILRAYRRRVGIESVCDLGCGLGYMSERLRSEVGLKVHGIDISTTAVAAAKALFNEVTFEVGDPLRSDLSHLAGQFDLVYIKEVLWYVLEDLDRFFDVAASLSRRYVYLSQSFPEVPDYVGKDRFPDAAALERFMSGRYRLAYTVVEKDSNYHNRELVHILGELR